MNARPQQSTYSADVTVVGINVWQPQSRNFLVLGPCSERSRLATQDENTLRAARLAKHPVWVEFELSRGWPDWYRSWEEFDRPMVKWDQVEPLLRCLGLPSPEATEPAADALPREVLRVLPFIYELGAARAFGEIRASDKIERGRSFAAAGFEVVGKEASGDSHFGFRPVCLNIASVDNLVFTMPQRRLADESTALPLRVEADLSGPPPLQVPLRYLPASGQEVTANDVVDGIALYLGATCEWVVESAQDSLAEVEATFFREVTQTAPTELAREDGAAGRLEAAFSNLQELGAGMRRIGRELALILQRVPAGSRGSGNREATARVEQRYENALKKVDELQMQLRLAGETMASALTTQQFVIAEKHRRLDEERRTEGEKLQRAGTVLASLILVPGLVAAIYGANVPVPGRDHPQGVMAMLLFMLGGGLLTWALFTLVAQQEPGQTAGNDAAQPKPWYYSRGLRAAIAAASTSIVIGTVVFFGQLSGTPPPAGQGQLVESLRASHILLLGASIALVVGIGLIAARLPRWTD